MRTRNGGCAPYVGSVWTGCCLILHTPAGFDDFIHDVSATGRAGEELDLSALAELAGRYGIEILGPGLSLSDQA